MSPRILIEGEAANRVRLRLVVIDDAFPARCPSHTQGPHNETCGPAVRAEICEGVDSMGNPAWTPLQDRNQWSLVMLLARRLDAIANKSSARCEYGPEGHGRCALPYGHAGQHEEGDNG